MRFKAAIASFFRQERFYTPKAIERLWAVWREFGCLLKTADPFQMPFFTVFDIIQLPECLAGNSREFLAVIKQIQGQVVLWMERLRENEKKPIILTG